jgi:1-phosphofructokinase
VSLGEDGMIAVPRDPGEPVRSANLGRVLSGNPTGAGDAAVAGIASVLARQTLPVNIRTVLIRATSWSAAAVLEPLAGSVNPKRVLELEAELELTIASHEERS